MRTFRLHALRTGALILLLGGSAACSFDDPAEKPPEMQTIETHDTPSLAVTPPPSVEEQPLPKPPTEAEIADGAVKPTPKADALQAQMNLPFAPAIAMDPIDGDKISITPSTPTLEYKKKIYYFSSAENKRAFQSSPDTYLKGQLASY